MGTAQGTARFIFSFSRSFVCGSKINNLKFALNFIRHDLRPLKNYASRRSGYNEPIPLSRFVILFLSSFLSNLDIYFVDRVTQQK